MKKLVSSLLVMSFVLSGCGTVQAVEPKTIDVEMLWEPSDAVWFLVEDELGYSLDDLSDAQYDEMEAYFKKGYDSAKKDPTDFVTYQMNNAKAYEVLREAGYKVPVANLIDATNAIQDMVSKEDFETASTIAMKDFDSISDAKYEEYMDTLDEIFTPVGLSVDEIINVDDGNMLQIALYDVVDGKLVKNTMDCMIDEQDEMDVNPIHQLVFDRIMRILPNEETSRIKEYEIATDGTYESMAYTLGKDNKDFLISMDLRDTLDENGELLEDAKWTIVHESGHIISLNDTQFAKGFFDRSNYTVEEGTFSKSSYMHAFYNRFWKDMMDEFHECEENDTLDQFYENHKDCFITDYAASNPLEDFAESYAEFVINDKHTKDTMLDQKIAFFYEYNEFVERRNTIRKQL